MNTYIDSENVEVLATKLTGPCILNTVQGEKCGEEGQWILYLAAGVAILDDAQFTISFSLKE